VPHTGPRSREGRRLGSQQSAQGPGEHITGTRLTPEGRSRATLAHCPNTACCAPQAMSLSLSVCSTPSLSTLWRVESRDRRVCTGDVACSEAQGALCWHTQRLLDSWILRILGPHSHAVALMTLLWSSPTGTGSAETGHWKLFRNNNIHCDHVCFKRSVHCEHVCYVLATDVCWCDI